MNKAEQWLKEQIIKLSVKNNYIYDSNFNKLIYPNSAIQDFNKQINYLKKLIEIAEEYKRKVEEND